jgi:cytochrome c-type biogenesis protein CcmH
MAMSPAMKLSGFNPVVVGARISRSGQVMPQSGDLIGQSAPVAPGTKALRIVIDAVQP